MKRQKGMDERSAGMKALALLSSVLLVVFMLPAPAYADSAPELPGTIETVDNR